MSFETRYHPKSVPNQRAARATPLATGVLFASLMAMVLTPVVLAQTPVPPAGGQLPPAPEKVAIRTDPPVFGVTVSPVAEPIAPGAMHRFDAEITGTTNQNITWTATGGTIAADGTYTAGSVPGTYTVTGTITGGIVAGSFDVVIAGAAVSDSYLSDRTWTSMTNAWGPVEKDRSVGEEAAGDGRPLTLNGVVYAKGLGTHAGSDVRYALNGACNTFTAVVGIDDEMTINSTTVFQIWTDGVKVFDSGVMTPTMPGLAVNVSVAKATELALVVTDGGNGVDSDHADWADARVTCSGAAQYLSDRSWRSATNAWGPAEKDRSNGELSQADGGPLTVNRVTYPKGLGVHGNSDVRYTLNRACTVLTAVIGVDDEVGDAGSVVFQVWADDVKKYQSGAITGKLAGTGINVDIAGAQEVALIVNDGGNGNSSDHADWADAQVICGIDTAAPTITAVTPASGAPAVPVASNLTAVFSEPMVPESVTGTTVLLMPVGGSTPVAATVTYAAATNTVTLDPTVNLASKKLHTITIKGGAAGVKDLAGNVMTADRVSTFTTGDGPDTTAPQLTTVTPVKGSTGVAVTVNATGTFTELIDPKTLTGATMVLTAAGNPVPATVTYVASTKTVTLDPVASLAGGIVHTLTIKGGANGVKDVAQNPLADDFVSTFTTVDTTPPTLTSITPAAAATGVAIAVNVTGAFSEPVEATTLTGATVFLTAAGKPVAAAVTYVASTRTVTLDPVASLAGGIVHTLTIKGGTSGVKDVAKNPMAADFVSTFTTIDTTPPTLTSITPATAATGVAIAVNVTGAFSELMDPATVTATTVLLTAPGSTVPVPAAVAYVAATRTVTLDPTANLSTGIVYTATIKGGTNGVKDVARNPMAADRVWTFTTIPGSGVTTYLSDREWTSMTNGWGPLERDRSNGEDRLDDGSTLTIKGTTYAKGLGGHGRSEVRFALNRSCSALSAVVGLDAEKSVGTAGFEVWTDGTKRYDSGVMTATMAGAPVDVSTVGVAELTLIINDGGDGDNGDHGDWADAKVVCEPDRTAPSVLTSVPAGGAIGFGLDAVVTAAFNEPMNAATVTGTTVLLTRGTTAVPSTVSYDKANSTVTLDPVAPLDASTSYTATIKAGAAGVKDASNNALASDKVWTFTTGASSAPTLTGIPIQTSDNPQTVINANPAGSTFLFKAGVHRLRTIRPRNGDVFNGEVGAVLNGAKVLTSFTTSGPLWRTTGATETQQYQYRNGDCQVKAKEYRPGSGGFERSWPRCSYSEEVFFDSVRQQHEDLLSAVGPGEYFFDYDADVIYFGSNPAGHLVETSMVQVAFEPTADNITIRRLTIEKYGSSAQRGAINGQENDNTESRTGWKVLDSIVQLNHAAGIRTTHNMEVANTKVLRNGQIGIVGNGDNINIHDTEIAYNNDAHFDEGWEAGGTKFVRTTNLILRKNWVHHNNGDGLWTDIDNEKTLFEDNTVEDNSRNGIHHEVSDSAIIRNNKIFRNGFQFSSWGWGGGIVIAASRSTEVYGNLVQDNADGITLMAQQRCPLWNINCSVRYGYEHVVRDVSVHDNIIRQDTSSVTGDAVAAGLLQDKGDNTLFTSAMNNTFYKNTYQLKSDTNYFAWQNREYLGVLAWQGYLQDTIASGGSAVIY